MNHREFGAEFYPTPRQVVNRMVARVSKGADNILEPSAGKGDLAEALRDRGKYERYGGNGAKVDCIEANPELAAILTSKGFPVVGYDWPSYAGVCYYDAICMNPPFSAGAAHLLKAWDFMHGGEIVCLLNAETVENPCTRERRRLAQIIDEHGEVEALDDCFRNAERSTDARVVLVYLRKVAADDRIEVWATETEERDPNADIGPEAAYLAVRDELGNMEHYYNDATTHMLKAFAHLRKAALYMGANDVAPGYTDYEHIPFLAFNNINAARAEFTRKHRRDCWNRVFNLMQFHKWLDKQQTDQILREVETHSAAQFTAANIKGTLENILSQRKRLFEQSVANVFDELTRYYKGNTNHVEGWKSNDNYKVNKKLVFPWGCEFGKIMKKFELRWSGSAIDIYNDLDRILCVLDERKFEECHRIERACRDAFDNLGYHVKAPFDNQAESEYFHIRFFKKGTVHLKWKREDLWRRFNETAAAGKKWIGENTQAA